MPPCYIFESTLSQAIKDEYTMSFVHLRRCENQHKEGDQPDRPPEFLYNRCQPGLNVDNLMDLNQIATGIIQNRGDSHSHIGWLHRELNAQCP